MNEQILKEALDYALFLGVQYADARLCSLRTESISVKNGHVQGVDSHYDFGIGVRVVVNGSWGFASNPDIYDKKRMKKTVERAMELARASARVSRAQLNLSPRDAVQADWGTDFSEDPFQVSLEEKLELLLKCSEEMGKVEGVAITTGSMDFYREERLYMDTEGARLSQMVLHSGAGISATSLLGGEVQTRSYPSSFRGNHEARGYEAVREMDLMAHAERIAKEAVQLHTAKSLEDGKMDLILGGSQLALQVHESCGHAVELDRVLGYEANFAGTSFLTLDKWKNFTYGSDKVNLVQDGATPGALGTAGFDDEGTPTCKTDLVKEGQFVGYLKSRDCAYREDGRSNGACRAQGWKNVPIVRMTNIHLMPGQETLEQLISSTRKGILLSDNSSWSIDDKRWNFQFGCEIGWLIENGKIADMVKNPTYTGITPEFWGQCTGIAGKDEWKLWGTPNCGKGQPMQVARVGHGVSWAKFENQRVGVNS